MNDKLKKILAELWVKHDLLTKEYLTMENKNTSGYYLALGKADSLGETIEFIESKYPKPTNNTTEL